MSGAGEPADDRVYSPAVTAEEYLGGLVTAYWLNQKARDGRIPCTMIGRGRGFSKANILKIIAMFAVEPTAGAPKPPSRKTA